jgi:hypothetical protein
MSHASSTSKKEVKMKRLIENVTGGYGPSARVVDGTLILSLPDAITPVVWRLDLGQTKASALEVRTDREDDAIEDGGHGSGGRYTLVLKTPKGEVHEIAPYDSKARAVQALMAVSYAMETAQGQMRPFGANDGGKRAQVPAIIPGMPAGTGQQPRGGRALTALGAFALVVVLIAAIMNIGPRRATLPMSDADLAAANSAASLAAPATGAMGGGEGQQTPSGVPVSADQFLQKQQ